MENSSKEKQIEEMTKDVTRSICWCNEEFPTVDGVGTAITLYIKGYRKSTEVAREIFEAFRAEIRSEIARNEALFAEDEDDFYEGRNDAYLTAINCLAELKKKYIGEDTNVVTNTEDGK